MQLLATFKPEDVEPATLPFNYGTFKSRTAARAVVFDGPKVALIHVGLHDYYMLPGGGIDTDDIRTGLAREIREELGCEIELTAEVGSIEVYFDRWRQKQTDHCYVARKIGHPIATSPTSFETQEDHQVVWAANIQDAIQLISQAAPRNRDGKLIRARDLRFLQAVIT